MLLDSEGHIKVTDFGLAKHGMNDEARTNSFIGTMEVPMHCLAPIHSQPHRMVPISPCPVVGSSLLDSCAFPDTVCLCSTWHQK